MSDTPEKTTPAPDDAAADLDARPGPKPAPALEKTARILAAGTDENARARLGVEVESPLDLFRAWGQSRGRGNRDKLTDALRHVLVDILNRNATLLGPSVVDVLRPWAEQEANIEALAEWLDTGGWDKVNGDKVESRLVAAASAEASIDMIDGMTWINMPRGNAAYVMFLDVPRADRDKEEVRQRMARINVISLKEAVAPILPEGYALTVSEPFLLGLDALRAGLELYDWGSAAQCLTEKAGKDGDWLSLLAGPWMDERAKKEADRLERERHARTLEDAPRVHIRGRDYGRLPKVAAGFSWAFGGPGVPLETVELDGKIYAPAPDLAIIPREILVPASYALLPADHKNKPLQTLLPLDTTGSDYAPPLPVALAGATQYALTAAAGKLGLLVMAAAWAVRGKVQKATLRELTKAINPNARLVKTHFETVLRGLVELDGLRLVLPDGMAYRVFDCPIPWRELTPNEYDTQLFVGMTRTFESTLAAIAIAAGKSYKGDFLFDVTGAMALPTKRAALLRQYIRACAFWNAYWKPGTKGEPDPDRVPEVTAEHWAAMNNYLPPAAAEYAAAKGKKGDRRALSRSLKDTLADAAELDALGLVKIARADRKAVRILPPEVYLEAWQESRKGAHRIPGKPIGKNPPDK